VKFRVKPGKYFTKTLSMVIIGDYGEDAISIKSRFASTRFFTCPKLMVDRNTRRFRPIVVRFRNVRTNRHKWTVSYHIQALGNHLRSFRERFTRSRAKFHCAALHDRGTHLITFSTDSQKYGYARTAIDKK
jgi:hypothetical protein